MKIKGKQHIRYLFFINDDSKNAGITEIIPYKLNPAKNFTIFANEILLGKIIQMTTAYAE
ncbi:hypothetical protein Osc1_23780 [Hominimerdicola sp. 21CYCFAH17_S]